jgi:hypothetical protein
MANPPVPQRSRPARWAVGLFVLSASFALISIALISTGFSPV